MGEKGLSDSSNEKDSDFAKRREEAMARVQLMDKDVIHSNPEREQSLPNCL